MRQEPKRADDMPVTRKMFDETAESLRSEIRALDRKMDARFIQIDSRFDQNDSKFAQVDARFDSLEKKMDARFESFEKKMDSKIELVLAAVHRNSAIIEEQNARNQYVLDAWAALHNAQERQKHRLAKVEKHIFGIEQE